MTCCYGLRRPSSIDTFFSRTAEPRPNLLCSVCGVGRREVLDFVRPPPPLGRVGFGVEGVGLMYFLRNLLVCSGALSMYSGDG